MEEALLPIVVFLLVYVALTFELVNKAVAALLGVMILLVLHVVSEHQAVEFIDFETIMLLLGMMSIVAILRKSGFFFDRLGQNRRVDPGQSTDQGNKVFMGALSITEDMKVISAIGSANIVSLCHLSNLPVYLFANTLKFPTGPHLSSGSIAKWNSKPTAISLSS